MAQKNTPALIIARESREGLQHWPGPRHQDQDSSFGQSPLGFTNKSNGTSVTSGRGYSDCQPWFTIDYLVSLSRLGKDTIVTLLLFLVNVCISLCFWDKKTKTKLKSFKSLL